MKFFVLPIVLAGLVAMPHVFAEAVVKKGPVEISAHDLNNYALDRVPPGRQAEYFSKGDSVSQLAESLLIIRALAEEAEKSGAVDAQLIDWQVELHRDRLMMDQYLRALAKSHTDNINWEETARDVYLAEPDSFAQPERVRASHILIKTEERSDEEALALANEVQAKLKSGTDFKLLAAQYSEDPSAKTNLGALGMFGRGQMVPEFDEAVFALREPGDIAGPVKTQFGYHVIQLEQYQPAHKREFDDVKDEIIAGLQQEIPNKIRQDKIMEIRSSDDIEVDSEQLEALLEKFRAGDFE